MGPSTVPTHVPASQAAFLDDVGRALRAWREAPLLPVVTLLVALVYLASGSEPAGLAVAASLLALLLVGWPGAERLWYLRVWTGRDLTLGEAGRATLSCFGRFFVLALVVGLVAGLLLAPMAVVLLSRVELSNGSATLPGGVPAWVWLYTGLVFAAGYAALTFVTPALVYSSRRIRDAVPLGLRLLRVSWPHTAAYVLVPALVAGASSLVTDSRGVDGTAVAVTVVSTLLFALSRGATAAYYLRVVPGVGANGAVRVEPEPGFYPPAERW